MKDIEQQLGAAYRAGKQDLPSAPDMPAAVRGKAKRLRRQAGEDTPYTPWWRDKAAFAGVASLLVCAMMLILPSLNDNSPQMYALHQLQVHKLASEPTPNMYELQAAQIHNPSAEIAAAKEVEYLAYIDAQHTANQVYRYTHVQLVDTRQGWVLNDCNNNTLVLSPGLVARLVNTQSAKARHGDWYTLSQDQHQHITDISPMTRGTSGQAICG